MRLNIDGTDEQYAKEFDECESYVKSFYTIKCRVENLRIEGSRPSASRVKQQRRNITLPKIELTKFDDNTKTWLSFWGQFKKIDEDDTLESEDKFQYLIQAMKDGSKARELVTSYPPLAENYKKALEQLKGRFAKEEILIDTYVRELLGLVLCQAKGNTMGIRSLYDQLMTHLNALESLKVTKEKYEAMLYPLVESALLENILMVWSREKIVIDDSKLTQLLEFLIREAEAEERIKLTRANFNTYIPPSSLDIQPTAAYIVA
ncbi:unnamed protein product [Diatraea saccharalis]|uniref:Uncharacterized protein n=1 Tax=Diatraea saccharalis TaxID=40085 RepID=A0A9N9QW14_9NEOP|nr:unnamed protein product [Diatraea saccharalis]